MFPCCFPDPLAPVNLTLGSPSASALVVSWAVEGGGAEGFVVDVSDAASSTPVGHTVLGGDARSHILRSLSPGTSYSVAVRATAGPFHASTPNFTHCTREFDDALLAARCSSPHLPFPVQSGAILVQLSCLPLPPMQVPSAYSLLDAA